VSRLELLKLTDSYDAEGAVSSRRNCVARMIGVLGVRSGDSMYNSFVRTLVEDVMRLDDWRCCLIRNLNCKFQ
jgi:hypothetical protein